MAIALFGGSFDPVHVGHVAIVESALQHLDIKELIILPTYINPFKKHFFAPPHLRLKWLKEVFDDIEGVCVSDYEVLQEKPSYTIDTIRHFKTEDSDIYFIIGADNVASLHKWYQFEELSKMVTWVVATRESSDISGEYIQLHVNIPVSSTQLREKLDSAYLPKKVQQEIVDYYKGEKLKERIEKISHVLDKHKAEAIEVFDLEGKDYFVKAVIIASSLGNKHTLALLDHLKRELKPQEQFLGVDESDDWVVADLGDLLIHIMTPEYRSKYDIETLLNELPKAEC